MSRPPVYHNTTALGGEMTYVLYQPQPLGQESNALIYNQQPNKNLDIVNAPYAQRPSLIQAPLVRTQIHSIATPVIHHSAYVDLDIVNASYAQRPSLIQAPHVRTQIHSIATPVINHSASASGAGLNYILAKKQNLQCQVVQNETRQSKNAASNPSVRTLADEQAPHVRTQIHSIATPVINHSASASGAGLTYILAKKQSSQCQVVQNETRQSKNAASNPSVRTLADEQIESDVKEKFADEKRLTKGLHYDGYNYHCKNKKGEPKTKYGCVIRKCPALLSINDKHDESSITLSKTHYCSITEHKSLDYRLFYVANLAEAQKSIHATPHKVFQYCSQKYPQYASAIGFPKLQRPLQKARNKYKITSVKSGYPNIQTFYDHLLELPDALECKISDTRTSKIKMALLNSSELSYHLAFYDEDLLKEFTDHDIFSDATFSICPDVKNVHQIFIVMGKKHFVVVPFLWVLMSRRTTRAYCSVWEFIKKLNKNFEPKKFHCDFEKAMIKAMKTVFSDEEDCIRIVGCWFHYCQAIIRRLKKDGLMLTKDNATLNPDGHLIMRYLLLLALLPPNEIKNGIKIVKNLIKEKFQNNPVTLKRWLVFIRNYYEGFWNKVVTPEVFSVHDQVDRTNNYVESNNHLTKELLRTKPTCYAFIESINKMVDDAKTNLRRAQDNIQISSTPTLKSRLRDQNIRDKWVDLRNGEKTEKFLKDLAEMNYTNEIKDLEQAAEGKQKIEDYENEIEDSDNEIDADLESLEGTDDDEVDVEIQELMSEIVATKTIIPKKSTKRKTTIKKMKKSNTQTKSTNEGESGDEKVSEPKKKVKINNKSIKIKKSDDSLQSAMEVKKTRVRTKKYDENFVY